MFCFCDKQTLCIYMSCIYSFFCKLTMIIAWIVGTEIPKTLQASLGCRNSATESIAIPYALVVFLGGTTLLAFVSKQNENEPYTQFFSGYSALRSCAVLDYFVTTVVCMYIYIYIKWCHIVAWHVLHSWTALCDTYTLLDFSPLAIFRFWSLFHALKISEIPTVLLNYT